MNDKLDKVVKEVKNVDYNINEILVPILQDTIADSNRHNKRMFIITIISLIVVAVIGITSMILVYEQNKKYQEFLSQFDFETTETIYQDTDDNSVIYDGISINR